MREYRLSRTGCRRRQAAACENSARNAKRREPVEREGGFGHRGARGIGYVIAERLVREDVAVTVLALHPDSAERAVSALAAHGGKAIAIAGDVSDEDTVRSAVEETVTAFGRLDIMVNNAGTISIGPLVDMTTEAWDRVMK